MPKQVLSSKDIPIPSEVREPKAVPDQIREETPVPKGTIQYQDAPDYIPDFEETPTETKKIESVPEGTELVSETPTETPKVENNPNVSPEVKELPNKSELKEELPSELNEENVVVVNGKKVELKPTKLKYFRNKAASAYGIINAIPLHELLTYEKGVLDPKRTADDLVFDFLIAAFDDVDFVKENYNEMDADTVDRVCKIFARLNHIDEKQEAARKNKEAQAKR